MLRMKRLRLGLSALAFAALADTAGLGHAQNLSATGTPMIMAPEPGERPPARRRSRPAEPSVQSETKPAVPVRRARGSSSPSPLPPYQSPPSPQFTAPRAIEGPRLTSPPAVPTPVPGFATIPPPPTSLSGQTFQDKAIGCAHYGATQGIGAGEIGAYSGSCINSR